MYMASVAFLQAPDRLPRGSHMPPGHPQAAAGTTGDTLYCGAAARVLAVVAQRPARLSLTGTLCETRSTGFRPRGPADHCPSASRATQRPPRRIASAASSMLMSPRCGPIQHFAPPLPSQCVPACARAPNRQIRPRESRRSGPAARADLASRSGAGTRSASPRGPFHPRISPRMPGREVVGRERGIAAPVS